MVACRVIIAVITAAEKVADPFIGWLPLYCEAKLALIVYLWHPRTKVRWISDSRAL